MNLLPKNRKINDGMYLKMVDQLDMEPVKCLIDDSMVVKELLKNFDIDQLNVLMADACGTEESLKFINILLVIIAFILGVFSTKLIDLKQSPMLWIAIIVVVLFVLYLLWMSYNHRRAVGTTVFVKELIKIVVQEKRDGK